MAIVEASEPSRGHQQVGEPLFEPLGVEVVLLSQLMDGQEQIKGVDDGVEWRRPLVWGGVLPTAKIALSAASKRANFWLAASTVAPVITLAIVVQFGS